MPIPYGRQHIDEKDIAAVVRVLRSPYLTQGPEVAKFEKALAKKAGTRFAVAAANGTIALELAYRAAGIGAGDEVITTPNTFVATANMLRTLGAKPVFCDIRLDTYNLDETKVEKLIGPKTRALVPVHFAGHPVDMDRLRAIASKQNLMLIADAAHALGAQQGGRPIGAYADMSVLSFHPVKSITTGEGGAVLTDDETLYKKLLLLRSHGIEKDADGFNVMRGFGLNARMPDIAAALGRSQLTKLGGFMSSRRKTASLYQKLLFGIPGIVLPKEEEGVRSAWHLYVIRTKDAAQRLPLARFLKKKGIGVNFHYPAVYAHPYYREHGYADVALSNMDAYAASSLTLPLFASLKEKEVRFVANAVRDFFAS